MITRHSSLIGNAPLSWTVRVFALVVLIVLLGGIVLLVAPEAIMPRWPWRLGQYSARFLGAIYSAEFVALSILVAINRVAPGRLMLAMALVFTFTVTLVSAFHLDEFNFGRRGPWGWFALYGGSAVISAALLWQHRHLKHPGAPPAGAWRLVFMLEAILLGGYGTLMLVSPESATAFWPWPADTFTGRVYSGMFLAAGFGAYTLSRRRSLADYMGFGVTQVTLGLASLGSYFLVQPASSVYSRPDPTSWIIACCTVMVIGLVALYAAHRAYSDALATVSDPSV